eukprot:TRINITY_DN6881_c0_g1_i1.p1 TRINITY_DN6881_c0_g1~~TRINITY_DN6881_c0_g1_i1.p1  ORF type:complete len:276 (+),score=45.12 TRINITY_DN6881_c0_g1_i1:244-1071(+)
MSNLFESLSSNTEKKHRMSQEYRILSKVSEGSSSRIFKVQNLETNQISAAKVYRNSFIQKSGRHKIDKEKRILEKLKGSDLFTKYHHSFTDGAEGFVMDLYETDLFDVLVENYLFCELQVKVYVRRIVDALDVMHRHGIVYRDLKLENILLDSRGEIVLADFGLSKVFEMEDERSFCFIGTMEYIPPEMILGMSYRFEPDWWQLGILMYEMLVGFPPFEGDDPECVFQSIVEDEIIFPCVLSPDAKDLITQLTKKEPRERLQDPDRIRNHPFLLF